MMAATRLTSTSHLPREVSCRSLRQQSGGAQHSGGLTYYYGSPTPAVPRPAFYRPAESRGRDASLRTGLHGRRRGPRHDDDPGAHHDEGERSNGQYGGVRHEVLTEQPHAQGDADHRIDDHQERL